MVSFGNKISNNDSRRSVDMAALSRRLSGRELLSSGPGLTQMLNDMRSGNHEAADRAFQLLKSELRGMAKRHLIGNLGGNALETTALIDEAFVKLLVGKGERTVQRRWKLAREWLATRLR